MVHLNFRSHDCFGMSPRKTDCVLWRSVKFLGHFVLSWFTVVNSNDTVSHQATFHFLSVLNFEFFDKLSLSWISYSFCHKFDMMLMLFNVFQIQLMCLKIFWRCNLLCIKLISVICLKKKMNETFHFTTEGISFRLASTLWFVRFLIVFAFLYLFIAI